MLTRYNRKYIYHKPQLVFPAKGPEVSTVFTKTKTAEVPQTKNKRSKKNVETKEE